MKHVLLDFCDLPASHTAVNLKDSVLEILRDFDISHKILGFTMDGAANMNAMFNLLQPCLQCDRQSRGASTESKLNFCASACKNWFHCGSDLVVSFLSLVVSEFQVRCICHALNNVHEVGVVDDKKIIPRVRILVKTVKKPKAKKLFNGNFFFWNWTKNYMLCDFIPYLCHYSHYEAEWSEDAPWCQD